MAPFLCFGKPTWHSRRLEKKRSICGLFAENEVFLESIYFISSWKLMRVRILYLLFFISSLGKEILLALIVNRKVTVINPRFDGI